MVLSYNVEDKQKGLLWRKGDHLGVIKTAEVIKNTISNTIIVQTCTKIVSEAGEKNTDSKNHEDSKILPLIEKIVIYIYKMGIEGSLGTSGSRVTR